jgi:kynurenine formamidase
MKRLVLSLVALAAACGTAPAHPSGVAGVFDGTGGLWVDLSWPSDSASVGEGTRMDAPVRFAEGHLTADRVPLEGLIGPAAVVDVSARADADYQVSVKDLEDWESRHGELPNGGILLLRTGWESGNGDPAAYLGTGSTGSAAGSRMHFPGLDPEAARWLVAQRGILAVGIDTPALDRGASTTFDSERVLYAENMVGFTNVANLGLLPEAGSYVVALPLKIEGGSAAPARIVAFIPR